MKKILSILTICLVFIGINCCIRAQSLPYRHYFEYNGQVVLLEEALTQKQKMQGLMGRKKLADNTGMVFIYDGAQELAFWMKGVLIPLDIIFLKDGEVTKIYKNAKVVKEGEPYKIYPSKGLANQVIEVNSGFCKEHGIKKGSIIKVLELKKNCLH